MEALFLGVDIGGTKCAVLAGNQRAEVLERVEIPTNHEESCDENIEKLITISRKLIQKYREKGSFEAVGISCGGPLDEEKGIIQSPPNLPGWDHVLICRKFEEALGIPAFLQNDANACAVAEWKFGAGAGCRNVVFLTFGTGLGAGLILNGRLYSGTNGMAGEVGHIRLTEDGPVGYGKAGSFEGYCSGGGIADLCRYLVEKRNPGMQEVTLGKKTYPLDQVTAKIIFQAAPTDPFAAEIVECCGRHLGKGLAVLVDILNPEKIILGSIFVRGETLLRDSMEKYLRKEALPQARSACRIVPAALGERLGDVAALSVGIYRSGIWKEEV